MPKLTSIARCAILYIMLVAWPACANALSCSFSITDVAFGNVDLSSGQYVDTTAVLTATCTGNPNQNVRVCPNIAEGSGGNGANGNPRYMLQGSNALAFQLYSDAARTTVWGSWLWAYPPRPPDITFQLDGSGNGSTNQIVYARILANQGSLPGGVYSSSFAGANTRMSYADAAFNSLGGERKYVTMSNGAKDLITALSQSGVNDDVKFALVPFSGEVYVTMEKKYWKGQGSSNALYSSCTRDRKGPYNTTDATPSGTGDRWGFVPNNNPSSQSVNCSSYASHHVEVRDLTTDHQGSLDQISQMSPVDYTNLSGAMDMAYQVLSPNAPFTNGVDYATSGVTKAVVLMTDGAQTTYAFPESGGTKGSVSAGETNLETLCRTMKAQGIRILTVSYDLYDSVTENRLKTCASDDADFYNADTREELVSAFSNITNKLARSMYLSE